VEEEEKQEAATAEGVEGEGAVEPKLEKSPSMSAAEEAAKIARRRLSERGLSPSADCVSPM
jgi:hypothetical protein